MQRQGGRLRSRLRTGTRYRLGEREPRCFVRASSFASLLSVLFAASCGGEIDVSARRDPTPSVHDEARGVLDPHRCPGMFAECDGDSATVCETDLASSPASCGACGHACPDGLFCSLRGCIPGDEVGEVIAIAYTTCVRKGSGEVDCWGLNDSGQLGDGTTENRISPGRAQVDGAVAIFGEARSMAARRVDGTFARWGVVSGEDLDRVRRVAAPEPVEGVRGAALLLPARECALKADGALVCWGDNRCGMFGNGETAAGFVNHPVPSLVRDAAAIASGGYGTCIAHRDGRVSCWGRWRMLGDGSQKNTTSSDAPFCVPLYDGAEGLRVVPGIVPGLEDATSLEATGNGGMCALHASGLVSCWGDVLEWDGYEGPVGEDLLPHLVEGLHDVVKLGGIGLYHGCAILRDGRVSCWGRNNADGLTLRGGATENPGIVPKLDHVVDLSVGSEHTCALRDDGELFCWGVNRFGELGDGTTKFAARPVRVVGLGSR